MVQTFEGLERLKQVIRPTTVVLSDALNEFLGAEVLIATEAFQRTGSFKFRAAYNVAQNVNKQKLIAASSGNFGQALAYACKLLQKQCIIVMPDTSAKVKVDAVRRYGGVVDFVDTTQKTRADRVKELAKEHRDAAILSAYDDPFVIEGNSTLGEELARLEGSFDDLIVPVGGGGLLSGIIRGMSALRCTKPIYGAEPLLANDAARSLAEGRLLRNDSEPQTIADGARTLSLGEHNWRIIKDSVAAIIEVPEDDIIDALRALFKLANLKVEPTGALSVAAIIAQKARFRGKRVCCVVSGGNVDPSVFCRLLGDATD